MEELALGIYLGASECCASVFHKDKYHIICDASSGHIITPSYVAFGPDVGGSGKLVGYAALEHSFLHPKNTIFGMTSIIGKRFRDHEVQDNIKRWPFKVVDRAGFPVVQVEVKQTLKTYSPIDINSMLLENLRKNAGPYWSICKTKLAPTKKVVIAVPVGFNHAQRKAAQEAGQKAGLDVIGLVNETTAAVFAYGLQIAVSQQKVLIIDLGRRSLEVTILRVTNGTFVVLTSFRNENLGSENFEEKLIGKLIEQFGQENSGLNLREDLAAMASLRKDCNDAAGILSGIHGIWVSSIVSNGKHFEFTIKRPEFETLCAPIFASVLETVENAVRSSTLTAADIDHVIPIGGNNKDCKVMEILQHLFPRSKLHQDLPAETVVAQGAASYARSLLDFAASNRVPGTSLKGVDVISRPAMPSIVPKLRLEELHPTRSARQLQIIEFLQQRHQRFYIDGQCPTEDAASQNPSSGINKKQNTSSAALSTVIPASTELFRYVGGLVERKELEKHELEELSNVMLTMLQKRLKDNKLSNTEELGDLMKSYDVNLALSVYRRANAPEKIIQCLMETGKFLDALELLIDAKDIALWRHVNHRSPTLLYDALRTCEDDDYSSQLAEEIIAAKVKLLREMSLIQQTSAYVQETASSLAEMAVIYRLYKEAFAICREFELDEAAVVRKNVKDVGHFHNFVLSFLSRNDSGVWSVLADVQLGAGMVKQAAKSYIAARNGYNYKEVVRVATEQEEWDGVVEYLQMVREKVNDEFVYSRLIAALIKTNRMGELDSVSAHRPVSSVLATTGTEYGDPLLSKNALLVKGAKSLAMPPVPSETLHHSRVTSPKATDSSPVNQTASSTYRQSAFIPRPSRSAWYPKFNLPPAPQKLGKNVKVCLYSVTINGFVLEGLIRAASEDKPKSVVVYHWFDGVSAYRKMKATFHCVSSNKTELYWFSLSAPDASYRGGEVRFWIEYKTGSSYYLDDNNGTVYQLGTRNVFKN